MSTIVARIARCAQNDSGDSRGITIRRRFGLAVALAAAGLIATSVESSGHFYPQVKQSNGTMADAQDYAYARRRLCYEISDRMGSDTNWRSWLRQAIDNWNSVSSETGWEFHPCAAGERANIRFDFADKTVDGTSASSEFGGLHGEEFHIYLLQDATGIDTNGTKVSGGYKGWGEKGATTLDPVLVIMHEMTHAMRLDHLPGSGWNTGNLEEPIGAGNHDNPVKRLPSATDVAQAKAAATNNKLMPSVSYKLPNCPDDAARAKAKAELEEMLKTARKQYDAAAETTTPRPRESSEREAEYNLYLQNFRANDPAAKATAEKAQAQALSDIEYIKGLLKTLEGKKDCPPPGHSSRGPAPYRPMRSTTEGSYYVGFGGGLRSTFCDNWHTVRVESTPGVDDPIGENPDACFSSGARGSIFFGYAWSPSDNWMAGVEADIGYANTDTTSLGIPGTVGSIVSPAGSLHDSVNVKETWDGSARGRLGFNLAPGTTIYGTAGLAWQSLQATVTCGAGTGICGSAGLVPFSASNSTTRMGWTLGGGVEAKILGAWLARGEYRYSDYGTYTATYGTRSTLGITSDIKLRTSPVLLGVAMKLGGR
jgi:outer membrane immunogenic protein